MSKISSSQSTDPKPGPALLRLDAFVWESMVYYSRKSFLGGMMELTDVVKALLRRNYANQTQPIP